MAVALRRSVSVGSSLGAFELLTRFDTGHFCNTLRRQASLALPRPARHLPKRAVILRRVGLAVPKSNDVCTLPASLMKNKREHTFPLALCALTVLSQADQTWLNVATTSFPARGRKSFPFNAWSKNKEFWTKLSGVTDWTLHDILRTFATRLAEMGVAPHVIEQRSITYRVLCRPSPWFTIGRP